MSVRLSFILRALLTNVNAGWYDSVYDEELGSQPCIFTSITPVRDDFFDNNLDV